MTAPLIIMVGADKGGVGKTTVSQAIAGYLDTRGVPHRALDTEHPGGGLRRFVPSAEVVSLETIDGQMAAFDAVDGVTLIDIHAGILSSTLRMLDRSGILDDVRSGAVHLALLHVLGPTQQSLGEVPDAREAIGGGSTHFLVKNHVSTNTGYFQWASDPALSKVLEALGPTTIDIPHLEERVAEESDVQGLSLMQYAVQSPSRRLRGEVRAWLRDVWAEFERVGLGTLVDQATAQHRAHVESIS